MKRGPVAAWLRRLRRRVMGVPMPHRRRCSCEACVDYRVGQFIKRCVRSGVWSKRDAEMMARVML